MSCEVVSASGTRLEPRGVGFPRTLISPQNLPDLGETLKDVDSRVSQKTFFSSIILAVESLVRMGVLSHQKKFQNYRPINDP